MKNIETNITENTAENNTPVSPVAPVATMTDSLFAVLNSDNHPTPAAEAEIQAGNQYDADGKLILTDANYYSQESNTSYMSVSQFKDFAGTLAKFPCEYTAYLKFTGVLPQPVTTPLLVGSYIDSYFEGTLDQFKEENKENLFKKTGDKGLKADFVGAENIIARIKKDPLFMSFMSGEKQKIMTANLFGVDWKIKMDSYLADDKIVDLKVMKDMKPMWSDRMMQKVDFIRTWGYDIQGAIYQKVVEINTGKKLPFFIACATKESVTDINIIEIDQEYLDAALKFVEENIEHVLAIKDGTVQPEHCNSCAICLKNKVLKAPIKLSDIIPKNNNDDEEENLDADVPEYPETPPEGGYQLF